MITVYTVAYNEELQIPYLIKHYRDRFSNCHIVVYDNMSTDNTVNIVKEMGGEVITYDTNNQIQDSKYLEIKNNCWKQSTTDWVLVCDTDELLDISQDQLRTEECTKVSIIKSEGYNMVNMEDNLDISSIKYGSRAPQSDKSYLFNKKFITEINYSPGCHNCHPVGQIKYSDKVYPAYHYNFINLELSIQKYKHYATRLSPENIRNGWGSHYALAEEKITEEFMQIRKKAIKLF